MPPVSDPILDSIKKHWNTLRAGRVAPFRAEIEPSAFEESLGNMFILERIVPGDVRIRLAGMKICELMGMEVRGMPLATFMSDSYRSQLDAIIDVVLDHPSTAEISLIATDADGHQNPAYLLLLPLRSDFGDISRIIGCLSFSGETRRLPVRMSISDQNVEPVEVTTQAGADHPLPGFYEDSEKFDVDTGPALRKVIDNRTVQPSDVQGRSVQLRLVHTSSGRQKQ